MFRVLEDGTIEMTRGDTVDLDITITYTDDEGETHEYDPSAGDIVTMTVKKSTKTAEALISKTGPHIIIEPEETEPLPYGKYVYDVQLTKEDGTVDTVITPTAFKILEEVTW